MQPVMNPNHPGLSVRVADEGFAAYIWGSDFSFEVAAYGAPEIGLPVEQWRVTPITPWLVLMPATIAVMVGAESGVWPSTE